MRGSRSKTGSPVSVFLLSFAVRIIISIRDTFEDLAGFEFIDHAAELGENLFIHLDGFGEFLECYFIDAVDCAEGIEFSRGVAFFEEGGERFFCLGAF